MTASLQSDTPTRWRYASGAIWGLALAGPLSVAITILVEPWIYSTMDYVEDDYLDWVPVFLGRTVPNLHALSIQILLIASPLIGGLVQRKPRMHRLTTPRSFWCGVVVAVVTLYLSAYVVFSYLWEWAWLQM